MQKRIPKIIHYCWFGGNPLPELAVKCIESWKKFCPGYDLKEWNESNYDVRACKYISDAYDAKKWAFVSDYARFDILYKFGGIYFDTDVELIAPIEDILLCGPFMGIQAPYSSLSKDEICRVNPGLGLAGCSGNEIFKAILDFYGQASFYNKDGSMNTTTVVTYTTDILKTYGLKSDISAIQFVEGIYIYPPEYFCPKNSETGEMCVTEKTRAIHHFDASWKSEPERKAIEFAIRYRHIVPIKIAKFIGTVRYGGVWIALRKAGKAVKKRVKELYEQLC